MVEKENLVKLTFNYYFIIGKATLLWRQKNMQS